MKENFSKIQLLLLNKWIPLTPFVFIICLFLLPSSKALKNAFYILILFPALINITNLKFQDTFKTLKFKVFFCFIAYSILSMLWTSAEIRWYKECQYILYSLIFCQLLYYTVSSQDKEWLLKATKFTVVICAAISLFFLVLNNQAHGGRFIFPTKMKHPIRLASVTSFLCLACLFIVVYQKNIKLRIIYILSGLIFLAVTWYTGSRAPLLALLISSGFYIIKRFKWKALAPIFICITLGICFIYYDLTGNGLQLSRVNKNWQELTYKVKLDKNVESISIFLGLKGEGVVLFDSIRLSGNEASRFFIEEEFENQKNDTQTINWHNVKSLNEGMRDHFNDSYFKIENKYTQDSFIQSDFIDIPYNDDEINLVIKAKVLSCKFHCDIIGGYLKLKYKDQTEKRIVHLVPSSRLFKFFDGNPRLTIWRQTFDQVQGKIAFGHGFGADPKLNWQNQKIDHTHNLFIGTFYSLGIVGLGLLLFCIAPSKLTNWYLTPFIIYTFICVNFDTPSLFHSPRELWCFILIPLTLWMIPKEHYYSIC